jgi:hypothetical protein
VCDGLWVDARAGVASGSSSDCGVVVNVAFIISYRFGSSSEIVAVGSGSWVQLSV